MVAHMRCADQLVPTGRQHGVHKRGCPPGTSHLMVCWSLLDPINSSTVSREMGRPWTLAWRTVLGLVSWWKEQYMNYHSRMDTFQDRHNADPVDFVCYAYWFWSFGRSCRRSRRSPIADGQQHTLLARHVKAYAAATVRSVHSSMTPAPCDVRYMLPRERPNACSTEHRSSMWESRAWTATRPCRMLVKQTCPQARTPASATGSRADAPQAPILRAQDQRSCQHLPSTEWQPEQQRNQ